MKLLLMMYNLIEYSYNYSDTLGSLWQFKRDEIEGDVDLTNNTPSSFKYKSSFIGDTDVIGANRKTRRCKNSYTIRVIK